MNQTARALIPQVQSADSGNKRALPAVAMAMLKNPQVMQAAIGKGVEVVGKLVDKSFENIEHAKEKAAEFLKKEVHWSFACQFTIHFHRVCYLLTARVMIREAHVVNQFHVSEIFT